MKILFYGINFAPELTATGKYTGEMAEWFAKQGHDVRVITAPPYYPAWKVSEDYKNAYECLSSEFKQNYFKIIDEFKNYVQKNFYDTNYITIKNVQTKSNVYTCTANIKSGVGVAADDMDKNFIIKLNPNAEFELSFEVE